MTECIVIFDVTSMYPAIIKGENISPEVKEVTEVMGERVVKFRKKPMGLIPRVVDLSLQFRNQYRELRLKAEIDELRAMYIGMEKSAKVGANATYGVMLYPPFRLYDKDCADAVTRAGRRIIRRLNAKCLKQNLPEYLKGVVVEVLYGDTDSLFLLIECEWSDYKEETKGVLKVGSKRPINLVSEYLIRELKLFCDELGYTEEVDGKIERILDRIFFKFRPAKKDERAHALSVGGRMVVGAKKKYAGRCRWIEGKGRVSEKYIKGFGRSDISIYTKGIYEDIWDALLEQGDVTAAIKILRQGWLDIKKQNWFDISVPRGVKGDFNEYTEDAKKGGHIAATLYMIENCKINYNPMVKPRTVCVKPKLMGTAKRELPGTKRIALLNAEQEPPKIIQREFEIDYDAQAETIMKNPFELIVLSLGHQWSEVSVGARQLTLDTTLEIARVEQEEKTRTEGDLESDFQRLRQSNTYKAINGE